VQEVEGAGRLVDDEAWYILSPKGDLIKGTTLIEK
jgi:hypothetical protein